MTPTLPLVVPTPRGVLDGRLAESHIVDVPPLSSTLDAFGRGMGLDTTEVVPDAP